MSAQDPQVTRRYPTESEHPPREGFVPGELPHVKPARGTIGPYQLLCELGAGGMGTVYVAQRPLPGGVKSTVALKTLKQQTAPRPNLAEMFLDEVRIIARISHPYVCAVRDLGMANNVPYVAMDYLIGEPLSRVMPVLPQPPDITSVSCVLRLVADLCEGLHAAHELRDEKGTLIQVVHRDISPDNLFVLYDGTVRVVDFGIASTAELQQKGKAQTLAGKCAYMSPEQLRVKPLDRRSDVWSVGVVLYEMLTGKRLFQRQSDLRTAVDVLGLPIDPPSKVNPLLPPAVDELVMRVLEREADARIESARALSRELEAIISNWFGLVPASRVGSWLQTMFPGSQEFRRRIVTHAEATREDEGHSGPQMRTRELEENVLSAAEGERAQAIRASMEGSEDDAVTHPELEDPPLDSLRNLEPPNQLIRVPQNSNDDPNAKSLISAWLDEQSTPKFEANPIEAIGVKRPIGIPTVSEPVELSTGSNRHRIMILAASLLVGLGFVVWWAQRGTPPKPVQQVPVVTAPVREEPSAELMRAPTFEPPPAEEPTLRPEEPLFAEPALEPAKPAEAAKTETKPTEAPKAVEAVKPVVRPPVQQRGNVYVIARDPSFRVLRGGREVRVPAMVSLPPGSQVIEFTREGSGKLSKLPVEVKAGTTGLLSLD